MVVVYKAVEREVFLYVLNSLDLTPKLPKQLARHCERR